MNSVYSQTSFTYLFKFLSCLVLICILYQISINVFFYVILLLLNYIFYEGSISIRKLLANNEIIANK